MSQPADTGATDGRPEWDAARALLRAEPQLIRDDEALLAELGLRLAPVNVIEFAPAALARLEAARTREVETRQAVEEAARANFAAQAQAHAAVIDLLDARNLSDLARRLDDAARLRFGLHAGAMGLEEPGPVPLGWAPLPHGGVDGCLGRREPVRLGPLDVDGGLFGERGSGVQSVALVRMSLWAPERTGLIAFGSADPRGFTPHMGAELIAFIARVVERVAERWPVA